MKIQFVDLKKQFQLIEPDIRQAIDRVLEHGKFIMGPEIGRLEAELAGFVGTRHAITCASGTCALVMALMAYNVGPGDAVLTSPFTFIATAEAISLVGATPVFVDIDPRTFNLDSHRLRDAADRVLEQGRLCPVGLIPVDLFGLPADYRAIMPVAAEKGLFVLEDAAQSFGGRHYGKLTGSLGHVAATSFFPAKPLGCYGDGGAVFTDDETLAERIRSIRVHGEGQDKYHNVRVGLNGRMDSIQAATLSVKLTAFPKELDKRQGIARRYTQGLSAYVETPRIPDGLTSAWAQYSILTDRRDQVQAALQAKGIPTAVYYPKPLHLQEAYAHLGLGPGSFPVAEAVSRRILSLPMHPYLEDDEIDFIIAQVIKAVGT
ncbi:MAG: DegT/DnrJ/EryC1/StrS family aminotransferase [Deltaproteobacteria bacterium]|nr:DegT/DnrJ/EryC1/StrS family aminotransferase [Deltaproteobacteria bacterium]